MTEEQFIPYVAYHTAGGDIVRFAVDTGEYPDDGANVDGFIIHRVFSLEGLNEMDFMQQRVWANDQWTTVSTRPNKYAYWDPDLDTPGWNWDTAYVMQEIRVDRNMLLAQSDWALLTDSPLTDSEKTEVQTYRTSLRDITDNLDLTIVMGSEDITWPTKPSCLG